MRKTALTPVIYQGRSVGNYKVLSKAYYYKGKKLRELGKKSTGEGSFPEPWASSISTVVEHHSFPFPSKESFFCFPLSPPPLSLVLASQGKVLPFGLFSQDSPSITHTWPAPITTNAGHLSHYHFINQYFQP